MTGIEAGFSGIEATFAVNCATTTANTSVYLSLSMLFHCYLIFLGTFSCKITLIKINGQT